jgi:hypothetical protein
MNNRILGSILLGLSVVLAGCSATEEKSSENNTVSDSVTKSLKAAQESCELLISLERIRSVMAFGLSDGNNFDLSELEDYSEFRTVINGLKRASDLNQQDAELRAAYTKLEDNIVQSTNPFLNMTLEQKSDVWNENFELSYSYCNNLLLK